MNQNEDSEDEVKQGEKRGSRRETGIGNGQPKSKPRRAENRAPTNW